MTIRIDHLLACSALWGTAIAGALVAFALQAPEEAAPLVVLSWLIAPFAFGLLVDRRWASLVWLTPFGAAWMSWLFLVIGPFVVLTAPALIYLAPLALPVVAGQWLARRLTRRERSQETARLGWVFMAASFACVPLTVIT